MRCDVTSNVNQTDHVTKISIYSVIIHRRRLCVTRTVMKTAYLRPPVAARDAARVSGEERGGV